MHLTCTVGKNTPKNKSKLQLISFTWLLRFIVALLTNVRTAEEIPTIYRGKCIKYNTEFDQTTSATEGCVKVGTVISE